MTSGFPFPGSVTIQPPAAAAGSTIRAEVTFADPTLAVSIRRVEAVVPEYGYRFPLQPSDNRFSLETQVPWEAPAGQYRVFFYAYNTNGEASAAQEVQFTVV